jgi:hypothetical protein
MDAFSFLALRYAFVEATSRPGWIEQFKTLYWRNAVAVIRNPGSLLARILLSLFIALISDSLYSNLGQRLLEQTGYDKLKDAYELCGSMFFISIAQLALSEFATVMEFV